MKRITNFATWLGAACLALYAAQPAVLAQGTTFTYQGRLNDGAAPADGSYDLKFDLFDAASGGAPQATSITNLAKGITNGLFTVSLDFGNPFTGPGRWLEIAVRTNGAGSFFALSPRQPLTPAPYAITAGSIISGGIPAGSYTNAVAFSHPGNTFSGAFSGNGAGITNLNASLLGGQSAANFWQLGGNNVAAGQFVGSTNNQPVELRANGQRGLRLEPSPYGSPNLIGGSVYNFIGGGVIGSTIAGGGASNRFGLGQSDTNSILGSFGFIGSGQDNTIGAVANNDVIGGGFYNSIGAATDYGVVAGGSNNRLGTDSDYSAIVGGWGNEIQTNVLYGFIGGGEFNTIETNADAAILGGRFNTIAHGAGASTIAGGDSNLIDASSQHSAILGGTYNMIAAGSSNSVVGGGQDNLAYGINTFVGGGFTNQAVGTDATVVGGQENQAGNYGFVGGGLRSRAFGDFSVVSGGSENSASGAAATVAGGAGNTALGNYSFAAGRVAKAVTDGTFVWADSVFQPLFSTAPNQFLIRAGGGVGINTNAPHTALEVAGTVRATSLEISGGPIRVLGAGLGTSTPVFIHRATTNISGNVTTIDHPLCNGDPNAMLIVTPNWNPGGSGGVYNNHPIGVYYFSSRWAIFNQDLAAIPTNSAFNVMVVKP